MVAMSDGSPGLGAVFKILAQFSESVHAFWHFI
jgi:hypothetical protein